MKPARTRFAPSPTGYMHVGGIRTALFAWLIARQTHGQFILRIEDTDRARHVEGAEQHIIDSLRALGLQFDEGPDIGGPFGPYRQSDRMQQYHTWALQLVASGRAYADPYTPNEVQQFREQAQARKQPFLYREHRPAEPPKWDGSKPLRFKSDPKSYDWHDEVMGDLHTGPEVIDDFVLMKSDGYPTYNFAHIVDDADMQITHVIRGQEFIASVPNYLNLYEALGITRPILATMPHILGQDGKKKLSKRDGAKDTLDYIREGYLTDALINFIASLGWNDGTTQEIFSRDELIAKFSLARVGRSGARFDDRRLIWMNGQYIRTLSLETLASLAQTYWPPEAAQADPIYKKQVLSLTQERLKYLSEIPVLTRFFFVDLPIDLSLIESNKQLGTLSKVDLIALLTKATESLKQSDFSAEDLQSRLNSLLDSTGSKPAILFSLIRIATTQAPASPSLAETMAILGKDRSLNRISLTIAALQ